MTRSKSVVKGVNNREQLLESQMILKQRINRGHMEKGVSIMDEYSILISPEAVIGQDTRIMPGTVIEGRTVIGSKCVVGPNAHLINAVLGDRVQIASSTVRNASVADDTVVPPYQLIQ